MCALDPCNYSALSDINTQMSQAQTDPSGFAYTQAYPNGISAANAQDIVDRVFNYHAPTPEQLSHLSDIREGFKALAKTILRHVPPGADRTASIRKLRESMMTANAAIVLNGLSL